MLFSRPRRLGILSLALLCSATPLHAQRRVASELRPGERVRLELVFPGGSPVTGYVLQASTDSLRVRRDRMNDTLLLEWADVNRLDLSVRQFSPAEGARRGARSGFVIGAVVTAVALFAAVNADRKGCDCTVPATGQVAILGVGFTVGTTLLGSAMGASAPGERWVEVFRRSR